MSLEQYPFRISHPRKSRIPDRLAVPDSGDESKIVAVPQRRPPQPKELDAGPFEAEVASFRLHLAAEGKSGRTIHTYIEAVRWFAAAYLLGETSKTRWEQVDRQDVQRWVVRLL
ncbi:MAG TPA: hypothetical protein VG123_09130, partial [Streptosporangiaceae bacterium]|nr:hypothetical protein [Streptosporangiaceae bacterium]